MNKYTENLEKVGDRFRIVETISVNSKNCVKVPLSEDHTLCEGKEVKSSKTGFRFKIWNSDESEKGFNYNGRNYAKVIPIALEQNLTTVSLMNHPEEDGDVRNICGVCKEPKLDDDGWMSCLFIPCGEYGKLIEDILKAGGAVSVSSSILGNVDPNGFVTTEDYVMERYMDVVFSPSNGLNQFSDKVEFQHENGDRDIVSEKGCISESSTIGESTVAVKLQKDNAVTGSIKGDKTMSDKLVETSMQMNIRSLIKDADKMENLFEKKDALVSAHSFADELTDKTLANEIQEKINSVESELKVLSEKGLKTDELSATVKTLTESKENLEKQIASMKEEKAKVEKQLASISTLYEEKQYRCSESELLKSKRLAKEVCGLKIKNRRQTLELEEAKRRNRVLEAKLARIEASRNTMIDADEMAKLQESKVSLESANRQLKESLTKTRSSLMEMSHENDNLADKVSRFSRIKNRILSERRNSMAVNVPSKITESTDSADDDKMEMMLNR